MELEQWEIIPDGHDDAAGRLVKEGKRSYSYSWLDKVSSVKENGVEVASFTYHMDGQIATAKANGRQENFLWDNLALISRNETEYVNEPYVTGGNPILADGDVLFNDLLGSTIGIRSGKEYRETGMTAFGETDEKSAMFTGKPYIGELGYAFLFRNYRPGLGKWQTSDPLGYPDGWNNLAYCENGTTYRYDFMGGKWGNIDFVAYYYRTSGPDWLDTDIMGLTGDIWNVINLTVMPRVESQIDKKIVDIVKSATGTEGRGTTTYSTSNSYSFGSICFSLGDGTVITYSQISYSWSGYTLGTEKYRGYSWSATVRVDYSDMFADPLDIGLEIGNAYGYSHTWSKVPLSKYGTIQIE